MGPFGEYVIVYLIAFTISVFLVPVVRRIAIRVGAIDVPDHMRKIHTRTIPRMGGVAIFVAFVVPIAAAYLVGGMWFPTSQLYKTLVDPTTHAAVNAWSLIGTSFLMLLLGIYDDTRGASPKVKIAVQLVAGLVLCSAGITIDKIANPFTGNMIEFGWLTWPLTIFWIMAITNAINLIDGMDGLGPGVGLFVAGVMLIIAFFFKVPLVCVMMSALVGAIIGFLIFNFYPAKIFMGDSGSLVIGFLLGAISIVGPVKRHTLLAILIPLVALALPLMDTLMAIVRRWSKGLPMSVPDKEHVHHRLMKMGFSQREAVFVLYGVSIILGCAALLIAVMYTASEERWTALPIVIAGATILAIIVAVHLLGGREFSAVGSRILDHLRRRRARSQAWVQVYQTKARLENAESLDEVWKEVSGLLNRLDLDAGSVTLSVDGGKEIRYEWTRPGSAAGVAPGAVSEGWTLRMSLEENGSVRGEMVLGKDIRRSRLPDALGEMIGIMREEMIKAAARLGRPPQAATTPEGAADRTEKASS